MAVHTLRSDFSYVGIAAMVAMAKETYDVCPWAHRIVIQHPGTESHASQNASQNASRDALHQLLTGNTLGLRPLCASIMTFGLQSRGRRVGVRRPEHYGGEGDALTTGYALRIAGDQPSNIGVQLARNNYIMMPLVTRTLTLIQRSPT